MHAELPLFDPTKTQAYLFIIQSGDPEKYFRGNVVEIRGISQHFHGALFQLEDDGWHCGAIALGRRRRLSWGTWKILFYQGDPAAPAIRAELKELGLVGGG